MRVSRNLLAQAPYSSIEVEPMVDHFAYAHQRRDEIVWMSQNTNCLPTDKRILDELHRTVDSGEFALYPYSNGVFGLNEAILKDLGLDQEEWEVLVTPGGIEALYILTRALLEPGDGFIASDPSFLPIHRQALLSNAEVFELPIYKEPWKLTLDQVKTVLNQRSKMLLLIDPLNPLGTSYTRNEVKEFSELAIENELLLVHDITYRDFTDKPNMASEFAPDRTIYAYSFSKSCGFAGLRIGALVAPKALMEKMRPFNTNVLSVNILAQRAALVALETKDDWFPGVLEICKKNQALIRDAVEQADGCFLPVYPSHTNMFIIDISNTGIDPAVVEERMLLDHGVFVRGGGYVSGGFGKNFIRVSFSIPTAGVEKFCHLFPKIMDELR